MHLGGFFHPTGNHVAAWLHPDAQIDAGTNFRHYVELARTAERGKLDLIFIADAAAVRDGNIEALKRWPQYMAFFDPTALMAGLAAVTERIGLVATQSATFNDPFSVRWAGKWRWATGPDLEADADARDRRVDGAAVARRETDQGQDRQLSVDAADRCARDIQARLR